MRTQERYFSTSSPSHIFSNKSGNSCAVASSAAVPATRLFATMCTAHDVCSTTTTVSPTSVICKHIDKDYGDSKPHDGGSCRATKLRFDTDKNELHEIPNLDCFSLEELNALWWDDDEYRQIKEAARATVDKMKSRKDTVESNEETFRGLENRTISGKWSRNEAVRKAVKAILDEQYRQWYSYCEDDEELARVYHKFSARSAKKASAWGLSDEQEAQRISKQFLLETTTAPPPPPLPAGSLSSVSLNISEHTATTSSLQDSFSLPERQLYFM